MSVRRFLVDRLLFPCLECRTLGLENSCYFNGAWLLIHALVFLSPPEKTVGDIYFFWGQLMAGALLGSVPVARVYSFFVEYCVTGLTGSVKG